MKYILLFVFACLSSATQAQLYIEERLEGKNEWTEVIVRHRLDSFPAGTWAKVDFFESTNNQASLRAQFEVAGRFMAFNSRLADSAGTSYELLNITRVMELFTRSGYQLQQTLTYTVSEADQQLLGRRGVLLTRFLWRKD